MKRSPRSTIIAATLAIAAIAAAGCGSKEPPIDQLTPVDLWTQGTAAYEREAWADAIRYFDRFALVAGADPRIYQARLFAAHAHFNQREYVTAATRFSGLAADLSRGDLADEARFMACRAYEELSPRPQLDQEYTHAAIDHCQALVDYFPDSPHVPEAQRIVEAMWHKLAMKVYQGGDWYFRRRAYDSAIIYFNDVVELYPRTAVAPRALARLVEVYEILEWDEEREAVLRQLLSGYPESPEARRLDADGSG